MTINNTVNRNISFLLTGFFKRKDSVISERYEMFASMLNEHFRFGHTFSEEALAHYGYSKCVFTVYIHKKFQYLIKYVN